MATLKTYSIGCSTRNAQVHYAILPKKKKNQEQESMAITSSTYPLIIRQWHLALRTQATAIVVSLSYEAQHQYANMSDVLAFSKKLLEELRKEVSLAGCGSKHSQRHEEQYSTSRSSSKPLTIALQWNSHQFSCSIQM